nr:hypothetical protein [uncultured Mucilaginibacter sp.]
MPDENKISINVTVNREGQKQLDEYQLSFNKLRDSLNSLSQPLNSFSNNINLLNGNLSKYTDSLSKPNSENQKLLANSDDITSKVINTTSAFTV